MARAFICFAWICFATDGRGTVTLDATHAPLALQVLVPVHPGAHVPPQPSGPQVLPVQFGVQTGGPQVPAALHTSVPVQVPQTPPQPSGPQVLPVQAGTQAPGTHTPAVLQVWPPVQVEGPDMHTPAAQVSGEVQARPSSQAVPVAESA
jgi:hypothetical protein